MIAIDVESVTKVFRRGRRRSLKSTVLQATSNKHPREVVRALDKVSFSVRDGESVAVLGHNGSGKSTILKLLSGTITPSSGRITTFGRVAPLLELGAGFHPDLTGRENIFLNSALLGVRRPYVVRHMDEIIEFAQLEKFIDSPVKHYSSGMSARLGFSVAVHVEPNIILMDEILAVGDISFQERCLEKMATLRDEGRTMLLVTHSLPQAKEFSTRAIVFNSGRISFDGRIQDADASYYESNQLGGQTDP